MASENVSKTFKNKAGELRVIKDLEKSSLRFITCGSVDDGKSTLLGRLLYDTNMIFDDQIKQLEIDSKKFGTQGKSMDFALLADGLSAEREQGITIDVSYHFFSTSKRKFIIADTPGHEQYTRNMVTGASTADAAIVLVDARKGVLPQTKRHSYLCNLLGINHIICAINKMDLVEFDEQIFTKLTKDFQRFSKEIGILEAKFIPISGLLGTNIISSSNEMSWYKGPPLVELLENLEKNEDHLSIRPFLMPIQWVNRPNPNFRGVSGRIVNGNISVNEKVSISSSHKTTTVDRIIAPKGEVDTGLEGQSVTITFSDDVDCCRGDILSNENTLLETADQFEVTIIWMDINELIPGRPYYIRIGSDEASATLAIPKYKMNIETNEQIATKSFSLNDIGTTVMTLDKSISFVSYKENRDLGGFILIDKFSNQSVATGLINFALRRSQNIQWQETDITKLQRSVAKNQKPTILWMTGLSSSGKSTIANAVEIKLFKQGYHTVLLDGDNIRHGLNKDLGFTEMDRIENIRRIGEVSKLMIDAGLIVVTAFISPFESERNMVREMVDEGEFVEIFIDTPLQVAETRDVKGLYAKARAGELKNFTGIDSPYETPLKPEIVIDTSELSVDRASDVIVEYYINLINR